MPVCFAILLIMNAYRKCKCGYWTSIWVCMNISHCHWTHNEIGSISWGIGYDMQGMQESWCFKLISSYGGFNDIPCNLGHENTWSPVGGTVWVGLEDVTLHLLEVHHIGMDFITLKTPITDSRRFDSCFQFKISALSLLFQESCLLHSALYLHNSRLLLWNSKTK